MNYSNIKFSDIANGVGVRTTLFVSGCRLHCEGCFNYEAWDFKSGAEFTPEVEQEIIDSLAPVYINGLSILGGEPFEPENQEGLVEFVEKVRATYPQKSIWMYSGHTWDQLFFLLLLELHYLSEVYPMFSFDLSCEFSRRQDRQHESD